MVLKKVCFSQLICFLIIFFILSPSLYGGLPKEEKYLSGYPSKSILYEDRIGGIINSYKKVLSLDPCENSLSLENVTGFNVGDTILIVQMKGARINSSNTSHFGSISSLNNAGGYEFNYIKDINGTKVVLLNSLSNPYDYNEGFVQIIRVPYFKGKVKVETELTCMPWNGSVGGILVFIAENEVELIANIDVSGKGYKGGKGKNRNYNYVTCFANDFVRGPDNNAGQKGESFVTISENLNYGKGLIGTGGGGGLDHNSGGGGGGNGGQGGKGGYQLDDCGNQPFDNRGLGGLTIDTFLTSGKIFLGGGGGAGDGNNPPQFNPSGGNGGGIIIIKASELSSNGFSIVANGQKGDACQPDNQFGKCHEGMGGGGAGGSIYIDILKVTDDAHFSAQGGSGANMNGGKHGRLGPGGGGGGGLVWLKSLSDNITYTINGGINGVNTDYSNDAWGALAGSSGKIKYELNLTFSNSTFIKAIPINLETSIIACQEVLFKSNLTEPLNSQKIIWDINESQITDSLSFIYKYKLPGKYSVKLISDQNFGCKDTVFGEIIIPEIELHKLKDLDLCENESFQIHATAVGKNLTYNWSKSQNLHDGTNLEAFGKAKYSQQLKLTIRDEYGCFKNDSLYLNVHPITVFNKPPDQNVCEADTIQIISGNSNNFSHQWSPSQFINNPESSSPKFWPKESSVLNLYLKDEYCGWDSSFQVFVNVRKKPIIDLVSSNDIDCDNFSAQLTASGTFNYIFHNIDSTFGTGNSKAIVSPKEDETYFVTGIDNFGCISVDSVLVKVSNASSKSFTLPNAFTPNDDGKNDCFGISHWGNTELKNFSIYNRWGEKIFSTTDPSNCWNGTYKGQKQDAGGYVYIIHIKRPCGDIQKKGIVYLIN